jgi:hypothetical protein
MKKIIYLTAALVFVLSASSCSKQCMQCQAVDSRGVVVNTSSKVCEYDFNRSKFEDRYKTQFEHYTTSCSTVH